MKIISEYQRLTDWLILGISTRISSHSRNDDFIIISCFNRHMRVVDRSRANRAIETIVLHSMFIAHLIITDAH